MSTPSEDIIAFFSMCACGIAIALIFDIFRALRRSISAVLKRNKESTAMLALIHAEDILFVMISTVILLLSTYTVCGGSVRLYLFAGAASGIALYFLLISRLFSSILYHLFLLMIQIFRFIFSFPIKVYRGIRRRRSKKA